MTEMLVQGTKGVRRRRTLEPYLQKVQAVLRREPLDWGHARRLSIDGVAVSLEPWVVACVEPQGGAPEGDAELAELLSQSLALWLKTALDVRDLRREVQGGSTNIYEAQAKLMLDSALGTALLQELQKCVDGRVQRGNLEEAKRLTKFRNQVSGLVRELKKVIADSNGPSAAKPGEARAEVTAKPAPIAQGIPSEAEPVRQTPVRRPRPIPANPRLENSNSTPSRYRTQILVALDVIALVAWFLLTMPSRMHDQTPRALGAHDFEDATPLVAVVARPPALYASVDAKTWSGFDAKQKRRFVDSMGSVLLTHGYWGLSLKTSDGRLVAEWLEKGGTRVLRGGHEGPSSPVPAAGQYSRFVP